MTARTHPAGSAFPSNSGLEHPGEVAWSQSKMAQRRKTTRVPTLRVVPRSEIWGVSGSDPWGQWPGWNQEDWTEVTITAQRTHFTSFKHYHYHHLPGPCLGKGCPQPQDLQEPDQVGQLPPGFSLACPIQPAQIQTLNLPPPTHPSPLFALLAPSHSENWDSPWIFPLPRSPDLTSHQLQFMCNISLWSPGSPNLGSGPHPLSWTSAAVTCKCVYPHLSLHPAAREWLPKLTKQKAKKSFLLEQLLLAP